MNTIREVFGQKTFFDFLEEVRPNMTKDKALLKTDDHVLEFLLFPRAGSKPHKRLVAESWVRKESEGKSMANLTCGIKVG